MGTRGPWRTALANVFARASVEGQELAWWALEEAGPVHRKPLEPVPA